MTLEPMSHLGALPSQRCFSPQTENDLWEAWSKSGNQGSQWNRAVIPLRNLRNFELIFEGIRSWDLSGGASLDDLEYLDCAPSKLCVHQHSEGQSYTQE